MKRYNIFISHSWNHNDKYEKLKDLLDKTGLNYHDHSIPKDDPVHTNGTDADLQKAIKDKMKGTSIVLMLTGVYATSSKWINKEIDIAKEIDKNIVGIDYYGAQKTSTKVSENAKEIVKWNAESLKIAIQKWG